MSTKEAEIWLVTGVSGCGWNELLNDVKEKAKTFWPEKSIYIYDVGLYMQKECKRLGISIAKEDILNVDSYWLETIRSLALKAVVAEIKTHAEENALFFIGVHAVFHWKNRLIPGVSYCDLGDPELNLSGVINVVDNIKTILDHNKNNPVRKKAGEVPAIETQRWMQEEELLSKTIADIKKCPFYVISKNHDVCNLVDFFKGKKKAIYLSYPITAIRQDNPEALKTFQDETLPRLQEKFVVFNPLAISDLGDVSIFKENEEYDKISELISVRTVQRDFRFINQSDAVIVYYNTEKNSPGVFAEIYYAFRTGKPVHVFYPFKVSPFLQDAVSSIDDNLDVFLARLEEYSKRAD